jgi:hypothetical protein
MYMFCALLHAFYARSPPLFVQMFFRALNWRTIPLISSMRESPLILRKPFQEHMRNQQLSRFSSVLKKMLAKIVSQISVEATGILRFRAGLILRVRVVHNDESAA